MNQQQWSKSIILKTFLFILLFPSFANSQATGFLPGFIVKNNSDTVYGLVKNKNAVPYHVLVDVKFKKDEDGSVETFSPDELSGYKIGNAIYASKYLGYKKKNFFFELIIKGYLSLYELELQGWGANNFSYFIALQKQTDKDVFSYGSGAGFSHFPPKILDYLKDAPDICEKIRTDVYRQKELKTVVREYNEVMKAAAN